MPQIRKGERRRRSEPAEQLRALDRARKRTTPREIDARDHVVGGQQRRESMPRYEFTCGKCKKSFELIMTFSEREKGAVKCPKCKGTKVVPQLGGFMAQTSKKS
jgi:putative FmdB family regulatory protein